MRVSHVITRLIVGGAQENTIASVLGLRRIYGLDVQLMAGATTGPEGSLEGLVAQIPGLLTRVPHLVRPVSPWQDWMAWHELTRVLRELQPDIVHTHSGKAGILGRFAARRAGVQVIIHTIHGPSFGPFQKAWENFLFKNAERAAGTRTTHFVTVANAMTRQYLEAGIGTPSQYTRILSGFDLEPFRIARNEPSLRARFGISPGDVVVGKIARLFELKGHDDLFRVAPELVAREPRLKFLLVGDGEWRGKFEALARDQKLEKHLVFAGLVTPSEVPRLIGIMDVVVHLSRREGLARALPQALAAAKPVVAYDCDGANEVCLDGETGFLIEPGDLEALRDRVLQLAHDPVMRERFGRRGQALVTDAFSVEKMVSELHTLYRRLLSGNSINPARDVST